MDEILALDLSNQGLFELPDLSCYKNLKTLVCSNNNLTSLDKLPNSVTHIYCNRNKITSLNNLPDSVTYLFCPSNKLKSLDKLRKYITSLFCHANKITSLDNLPKSITRLHCDSNKLKSLDKLPNSIVELSCVDNKITSLNRLPESIIDLDCMDNKFIYSFEPTLDNIKVYNRFTFLFHLVKCSKRLKKFHRRFRLNRCDRYKEELMKKMFHPRNYHKFSHWGYDV